MAASEVVVGLDCGSTVTKAVVYDRAGTALGSASAATEHSLPRPHWVERDMEALWRSSAETIRGALADAGVPADAVRAVATTGHGDGVYLVRADGDPVRPGILSLDSRAVPLLREWESDGTLDRAMEATGQHPLVAAPAALLAWLDRNEPDSVAATRWIMSCKDWVKFRLTGVATADLTEASESFTDHRTQRYSDAALAVYHLERLRDALPPALGSGEVAGTVTAAAAEATGLAVGTPVVAGVHDVDAAALGSGCVRPGDLAVVAGTYSINEVIADEPVPDPRWYTRNFVDYGRWLHMAISPASATNLEWFVRHLCPDEVAAAERAGRSPFAFVDAAVRDVPDDPHDVLFLPFLYGSPQSRDSGAAFVGLHGWHDRRHALRAVLDGVVFNHRVHIDALRERFPVEKARLAGGGARAPYWAQLFADALGLRVEVADVPEAGTLGAAVCAMTGAGWHDSITAAVDALDLPIVSYEPDPERGPRLDAAYRRYRHVADALADIPG